MKAAIIVSALLCISLCSIGQPMQTYISVKDSLPRYANIVAVLLPGKEFNDAVGDNCPILAQYLWGPNGGAWVTASSQPWDKPQITQGGITIQPSYWYPLPMRKVDRAIVKQ